MDDSNARKISDFSDFFTPFYTSIYNKPDSLLNQFTLRKILIFGEIIRYSTSF